MSRKSRRSESQPPWPICTTCTVRKFVICGVADTKGTDARFRPELVTIAPKEFIFRQGEDSPQFLFIRQGWGFRFRMTRDGQRQILSFLLPGDPVTPLCIAGKSVPFGVQAITEMAVCSFPRAQFEEQAFLQSKVLAAMKSVLSYEDLKADQRIVDLGRRTAVERISRFLLEVWQNLKIRGFTKGAKFEFPLRQTHLADAFGLTPVHVSRVMSDLRRKKLIEFSRETMTILNANGLAAVAGCREDDLPVLQAAFH